MDPALVYLTMLVLLPLVPAFVLFKTLPAEASAEGPFKGLKIKLSGGFAGYFLVLLLLARLLPPAEPGPKHYMFHGRLNLAVDTSADARVWSSQVKVSIQPPEFTVFPNGEVDVSVPFDPRASSITAINILSDNCGSATIPLDLRRSRKFGALDYHLHLDAPKRLLEADDVILLQQPITSEAQRDTLRKICGGVS